VSFPEESLLDKWASIFHVIGHPIRLAILLALHGSEYTDVAYGHPVKECLALNEIREVLRLSPESNEKLIYHVNQLIDADLVEKAPLKTESGEWDFRPHYKVTKKWIQFTDDFDIRKIVEDYFKKRG